jgi:hypothetical protein
MDLGEERRIRAKKLNKSTNIDAGTWNMVVDELKKRGLKF